MNVRRQRRRLYCRPDVDNKKRRAPAASPAVRPPALSGAQTKIAWPNAERSSVLRIVYAVCGLACVGLGAIGVILPGLPTTPFLLIASWCFSRSSRRLEAALLRSRLFGPLLRDWRRHRAIRRSTRNLAIALVTTMVFVTLVFADMSLIAKSAIAALASIGLIVILYLPVLPRRTLSEPVS